MKEITRYLTTPLYYVNSSPHIGHTYTTVIVDILKKYHACFGEKVFFLTGTDEHGEKIFDKAKSEGKEVKDFVDENSAKFKKLWDFMDIEYDDFIRTTERRHIDVVKYLLNKLYEKGDIYFDYYEGLYCVGCERFILESELVDGKCKDHGKEPKKIKEKNYFFKMSKYLDLFHEELIKNPDIIRPKKYYNEVLGYLKNAKEDLCISRPKSRLTWGIELPFDKDFVTYVWFDALTNYISAINYPDEKFNNYWKVSEHYIAKDILKTHTVYWCTMLLSAGIPLYKHLNVHGYWNMSGMKMSKSIGNVIDPYVFKEKYGDENLRFFFAREMHWGDDSDFTLERFINRYNTDLANNYGNLISRLMGMIEKYFDPSEIKVSEHLTSVSLKTSVDRAIVSFKEDFKDNMFYKTLDCIWNVLDETNKFITDSKPWDVYKEGDKDKLLKIISPVIEVVRLSTLMLHPIMPKITSKILSEFGVSINYDYNNELIWGKTYSIKTRYNNKKFFDKFEKEEIICEE